MEGSYGEKCVHLQIKCAMKQGLYILLLLSFIGNLSAKNIGQSTFGNLKNKAELVVIKDTRPDLLLTMHVKMAPFIETVNNAGISRLLFYTIYANLVRLDPIYANTEIKFHPDYSSFIFHLPNKPYEVERIISNIYKSVLVDSVVFAQARELTIQSYHQDRKEVSNQTADFEDQIQQYVWGDYHFKKYQRIEETVINQLTGANLWEEYDKYFKPSNTLFVLRGNFEPEAKFADINETTLYEDKVENNYIPIGKTNIYKNLISSSQIIHHDRDHLAKNKAVLTYQITGNYQNANGYFKLMVLTNMLNMLSKQILPNTKDLVFGLKSEKYAAEITVTYTPENLNKDSFYSIINTLNKLNLDSLVSPQLYSTLISKIITVNQQSQSIPKLLESHAVFWWNIQSLDNYTEFDSSISSINIHDLSLTYNKYIRNCPFVFMVNNFNLEDPADEFTLQSVDDTSVQSVFYYDYNISDLNRETEKEKLWKILQWLYINPNLTIQVNGHADKNEYLKADASTLNDFIDQYPQFKVVSSKIGKGSWQRLDMVRSLKIAKFLIDNGIDYNRVKGSGLLLDSEDKEGMQANQKVDFSYQRFRIEQ